jgi:tetratricopeptide (TPR) repeat protein
MASFSDKVKVLIDVDSTGAVKGVADFKRAFSEAETGADKLKVVGTKAFEQIKANATEFAAAAAVAIGKFALDATMDFQNLALEAGKFADATGLSLDEASRMLEVSGDVDVAATVVEKAFIRMNLAASTGEGKFNKFGIEVAKFQDGTYDPSGTFLNVIDALDKIRDPADKARVGTELLGKGWKEMTELITLGGPGLAAALNQVSDARIVDEEDLKAARQLRDAIDTLKDRFGDFALTLGNALLPKLAALVEFANDFMATVGGPIKTGLGFIADGARIVMDSLNPLDSVMSGVERVSDGSASAWERGYGALQTMGSVLPGVNTALDALGGWLFGSKDKTDDLADSTNKLKSKWELSQIAANRLRYEGLKNLSDGMAILDEDTNGLIDTFDALLGTFEKEEAWEGLQQKFKDYTDALDKAFKKGTPEAAEDAKKAMRDLVREIAGVSTQVKLSSQDQLKIVALLEKGQFDQALALLQGALAAIPRNIPITITGTVSGIPIPGGGQTPSETIGVAPRPSQNPKLRPFSLSAASLMDTSSAGTNVTVNVGGSVTSESDLVEAIRLGLINAQRSGKQLVYSTT